MFDLVDTLLSWLPGGTVLLTFFSDCYIILIQIKNVHFNFNSFFWFVFVCIPCVVKLLTNRCSEFEKKGRKQNINLNTYKIILNKIIQTTSISTTEWKLKWSWNDNHFEMIHHGRRSLSAKQIGLIIIN